MRISTYCSVVSDWFEPFTAIRKRLAYGLVVRAGLEADGGQVLHRRDGVVDLLLRAGQVVDGAGTAVGLRRDVDDRAGLGDDHRGVVRPHLHRVVRDQDQST